MRVSSRWVIALSLLGAIALAGCMISDQTGQMPQRAARPWKWLQRPGGHRVPLRQRVQLGHRAGSIRPAPHRGALALLLGGRHHSPGGCRGAPGRCGVASVSGPREHHGLSRGGQDRQRPVRQRASGRPHGHPLGHDRDAGRERFRVEARPDPAGLRPQPPWRGSWRSASFPTGARCPSFSPTGEVWTSISRG